MGKKTWRDRRRPPVFAFTVQTVDLTLKAVALFEQLLQRANHLDEKVVFAETVMHSVKQKLELMKESVGAVCLMTFDFNEKIVIRQSMLLYTIELLNKPPGPQRDRELRQCRVIATSFTDEERDAHHSLT
jgi:hypothetical protein